MDLSHVEIMHPAIAGALNRRSKFSVTRERDTIRALWTSAGTENPPMMEQGLFPTQGGRIDQWLEMRWDPPSVMYLTVEVTRPGEGRHTGYTMPSVHILTPQDNGSTLYFWAGVLHVQDQVPLDQFRASFVQTFENEDKPMLEAVAQEMGGETDLLAMKPLLLRSDAGSVLARRVLAERIADERRAGTMVRQKQPGRTNVLVPERP